MENTNGNGNSTTTLTPKNAKLLARLAELKDDKRSTDSLVNEALSYDIARQAKAHARLILASMGQKIQQFKKLGSSPESLEAVQNVIIKNAESFEVLATEASV